MFAGVKCIQCDALILEALAAGQWGEGQHPKLLGTGRPAHPGIAGVAIDYTGKTRPQYNIHELGEQRIKIPKQILRHIE